MRVLTVFAHPTEIHFAERSLISFGAGSQTRGTSMM